MTLAQQVPILHSCSTNYVMHLMQEKWDFNPSKQVGSVYKGYISIIYFFYL